VAHWGQETVGGKEAQAGKGDGDRADQHNDMTRPSDLNNAALDGLERHHPRMPVMVIPRIKVFCVKKNSSTIGRMKITEAAIRKPACKPC
jgi:hypothetical protein